MKYMKKAMGLLLTLGMVLALVTTAGAAAQTVDNQTTHNYKAYQIFSGTQAEGEAGLADVQWGSDMSRPSPLLEPRNLVKALKFYSQYRDAGDDPIYSSGLFDILYTLDAAETAERGYDYYRSIFDPCTYAAEYAEVLGNYGDDSDVAMAFACLAYRSGDITGSGTVIPARGTVDLAPGYYLIVDTTGQIGTDDAKNLALLQVTGKGDLTIRSKTGAPTVAKYVCERSKSDYWTAGTWGKTADVAINNPVWFRLVGTLPDNFDNFPVYKYVFHDTLSKGLVLSEDRTIANANNFFVFYLDDGADVDATYNFQLHDPLPSGWHLIAGTKYTVDRGTERDAGGNQEVTVTFNDLKTISGITEDSRIVVYYCTDLNRTANIGGETGNASRVKLEYSNDPNYYGSGTQTTSFTAEDSVRVFTYDLHISKIDGATADSTTPTTLSGAVFRLYFLYDSDADPATPAEKIYVGPSDTSFSYKSYLMKASEEKKAGQVTDAFNWKVFTNGNLWIKGVDAGVYYLEEITAPAGYNTLAEPIRIEIGRTLDMSTPRPAGSALSALTIKVDDGTAANGDLTNGVVTMNVANQAGATLPETGGTGTTLFYVLGGVLAVGAAAVLIVRRRGQGAA